MRKSIAALTAGALIAGGAMVATAQTDGADTTEDATEQVRPSRGAHLSEFFSEMVTEGVISQDQADQLTAELESRAAVRQAERAERRAAFEAAWEDDVLTVAELEELGADRILDEDGPFAEALADGEITRDEFDAVKAEIGPRGGRGHHRFGGAESETGADA